ncbi:MAG TPA: tRNA (adenosine(37)-N6)-dimethylallyltransferase MiaA, partial [Candidatus Sulfotelmatobacter sp.]|nr:tRNA (adenosine(37)-N6)-dimethylallyltransferase MiaA [Candidatus Sulfotelmatobacter sp.]
MTGPTGVGKSALALALAQRAPGEIVVADSMQVYRGLDVGTGKPTAAERARVAHHLLDIREPYQDFSAAEFAEVARGVVSEIAGRQRLPILVGGTGLYLRAFLRGALAPAPDPAIRARLRAEATHHGAAALHARLAALDPPSANRIHPHDLVRILRALEIQAATGRPPSAVRPGLWSPPRIGVAGFLVLTRERGELGRLIDARCAAMWSGGLLDETRRLLSDPIGFTSRRLDALGYRQARGFLEGRLSAAEALAAMQAATRTYAKRQLTWFRREPAATWRTVAGDS